MLFDHTLIMAAPAAPARKKVKAKHKIDTKKEWAAFDQLSHRFQISTEARERWDKDMKEAKLREAISWKRKDDMIPIEPNKERSPIELQKIDLLLQDPCDFAGMDLTQTIDPDCLQYDHMSMPVTKGANKRYEEALALRDPEKRGAQHLTFKYILELLDERDKLPEAERKTNEQDADENRDLAPVLWLVEQLRNSPLNEEAREMMLGFAKDSAYKDAARTTWRNSLLTLQNIKQDLADYLWYAQQLEKETTALESELKRTRVNNSE